MVEEVVEEEDTVAGVAVGIEEDIAITVEEDIDIMGTTLITETGGDTPVSILPSHLEVHHQVILEKLKLLQCLEEK